MTHLTISELELYSLGKIAPDAISSLEQHLLICERCPTALNEIEPYNYVHFTLDGPVYCRITKLRTGKFLARQWGATFEGGKEFQTLPGAKAYSLRTFARLFPEHTCSTSCGSAK